MYLSHYAPRHERKDEHTRARNEWLRLWALLSMEAWRSLGFRPADIRTHGGAPADSGLWIEPPALTTDEAKACA